MYPACMCSTIYVVLLSVSARIAGTRHTLVVRSQASQVVCALHFDSLAYVVGSSGLLWYAFQLHDLLYAGSGYGAE